jgi:hypothetical protein
MTSFKVLRVVSCKFHIKQVNALDLPKAQKSAIANL